MKSFIEINVDFKVKWSSQRNHTMNWSPRFEFTHLYWTSWLTWQNMIPVLVISLSIEIHFWIFYSLLLKFSVFPEWQCTVIIKHECYLRLHFQSSRTCVSFSVNLTIYDTWQSKWRKNWTTIACEQDWCVKEVKYSL